MNYTLWSSDVDSYFLLTELLVMTANQCCWILYSDFSRVVQLIVFSPFSDLVNCVQFGWGFLVFAMQMLKVNLKFNWWGSLAPFQSTQKNASCLLCLLMEKGSQFLSLSCSCDSFPPARSVSVFFLPHWGERKKWVDLQGGRNTSLLETTKNRSPIEGCLVIPRVTTLNTLLKKETWVVFA